MMEVGWSSLLVATLGCDCSLLPGMGGRRLVHSPMIVSAISSSAPRSCATSVGITARVFKNLGNCDPTARIILGAAVIDDVMGLMILAVVAGAIKATATGVALSTWTVSLIAIKALAFLIGAIAVGHFWCHVYFAAPGV